MQLPETKSKQLIGFLIFLAALIAVSFGNLKSHTFLHWDDLEYVINNNYLRPFTLQNILYIFSDFQSSNWHPITWLSYAFDFVLFGESPVLFKVTNLIIHFFNCVLVFYLAFVLQYVARHPENSYITPPFRTLDSDILYSSFIAALLFAVHPQHVESVSWISGRKDLLCSFFYLSAVIAYIHMKYTGNVNRWTNVVSLCYVFALMSKSMAVTFPIVIALLDIYPLSKVRYQGSLRLFIASLLYKKVMYIVLAASVVIITFITQTPNISDVASHGFIFRVFNSTVNFFYYIVSIIAPNMVTPYHPLPEFINIPTMLKILSVFLFFFIFILSYILYLKNLKWPLIVLSAYLVMLLPVIGLVHVGHASRADRYSYLPTTIFYILIGAGIIRMINRRLPVKIASISVFILALGVLGLITFDYNKSWANDRLVWEKVIEKYPESAATAYLNLGSVHFEEGKQQEAIDYYLKALKIQPTYLDAISNLAYVHENLKDTNSAEKYYKQMIDAAPDSHYPYTAVGDFYFRHQMFSKADAYYNLALQKKPDSVITLFRSSMIDFMKGNLVDAEKKIDLLLQLRPLDTGALTLKAKIKMVNNDHESAKSIAKRLLQLNPDDKNAIEIITHINTSAETQTQH